VIKLHPKALQGPFVKSKSRVRGAWRGATFAPPWRGARVVSEAPGEGLHLQMSRDMQPKDVEMTAFVCYECQTENEVDGTMMVCQVCGHHHAG